MEWLDLVISIISFTTRTIKSSVYATAHLAIYLFRLAALPVTALWDILLFVISPITHTIRFLLSPFLFLLNSFPRLQPLYIYFGSAAFIGLVFGIILKLTTSGLVNLLGLYDDPNTLKDESQKQHHLKPSSSKSSLHTDEGYELSRPITPLTPGSEQRELELLLANLSSPDSDLGGREATLAALTGSGGWRDRPNTKRKRRSASGLGIGGLGSSRFHTILEEDDDSL